jgi:hypothetical protein
MWLDCQMFEFRHLPVNGGIMAQDPRFLVVCREITQAQIDEEKRKEDKKEKNKGF